MKRAITVAAAIAAGTGVWLLVEHLRMVRELEQGPERFYRRNAFWIGAHEYTPPGTGTTQP